MAAAFTFDPCKAVMEDAAVQKTIDDLFDVWPEKAVFGCKPVVIDLLQRLKVILNTLIILRGYSIDIPFKSAQHWRGPFMNWLLKLDLGYEPLNRSLKALVDLFNYLSAEKKRIIEDILELAKEEKYAKRVELLESIPGIGTLSAMEILVEIQDITHFKTADELAAYLGLTPSQYSSGEHIRMGHITHAGNTRARTTLVESSWLLIGKDPEMKQKYQKIKERRGSKRAIVAVARNLSGRIRRMLLDQVPYKLNFQKAA